MPDRKILVVEDRLGTRRMLEETLSDEGYTTHGIGDGADAVATIRKESFDLIITDLELPGKNGLDVLSASRENDPFTPVIVMTAYGTVETAVTAMKIGAYDFLTKPVDTDRLLLLVERALERRTLELTNRVLSDSNRSHMIIGESAAIREVLDLAEKVARNDTIVLLLGESGTGKELFAHHIHSRSGRSSNQFVALNCAAIPRSLVETELFGAEKGAYTGADRRRIGKFELAHGGTLFLDEIGDLAGEIQSKFLRVIEEKSASRVGGTRSIALNVRLITATNRSLEEEVSEGNFREDLFYRLNVFPIQLPPLRDRDGDIPLLAAHMLDTFTCEMKRTPLRLSDGALNKLVGYEWPGNVRELRNTLERAVILTEGNEIKAEHLSMGRKPSRRKGETTGNDLQSVARAATQSAEIELIARVLRECAGNKSEAARRMNVSYRSLWSKIKNYEIQ